MASCVDPGHPSRETETDASEKGLVGGEVVQRSKDRQRLLQRASLRSDADRRTQAALGQRRMPVNVKVPFPGDDKNTRRESLSARAQERGEEPLPFINVIDKVQKSTLVYGG